MPSPLAIALLTLADIPATYHEPGLVVRVVKTSKYNCTAFVFHESALGDKDLEVPRTSSDVYFFGKKQRWFHWDMLFGPFIRLDRLNMHYVHPKRRVIHGRLIHTTEFRITPSSAQEL